MDPRNDPGMKFSRESVGWHSARELRQGGRFLGCGACSTKVVGLQVSFNMREEKARAMKMTSSVASDSLINAYFYVLQDRCGSEYLTRLPAP